MATDAITLRIDVLEQKMLGALGKIQGKIDTTKRKTNSWNKAMAQARNAATGLSSAFGFGIIISGIQKAISLHDQWIKKLQSTGQEAAKTGKEVLALALMQEKGKAGDVARKMAAAAPTWSPGQAWSVGQQMQAQLGSPEAGVRGLTAAHKLSLVGVDPRAAGGAVSLGMAVGLSADVAARAPYAAGESSSLEPQPLAEGGQRSLGVYRDPILGYAVMAEMSKFKKESGMMGTYAKMARQALMDPEKAGIWSQLGTSDKSFFGRLRALKAGGYETEEELTSLGFGEKRGREAVGYLLRDIGSLEQKYKSIRKMSYTPGLLISKRAGAEDQPEVGEKIKHTRVVATGKATFEREKAVPSTPAAKATQTRGMEEQTKGLARAIALQRMGYAGIELGEGNQGYTEWGAAQAQFWQAAPPAPKQYEKYGGGAHYQWWKEEYGRAYKELKAAENLERAAKNLYNQSVENR